MNMGVSIVTYPVDPQQAEELNRRVQDHLVPIARQVAGYRGFLLIDQGTTNASPCCSSTPSKMPKPRNRR